MLSLLHFYFSDHLYYIWSLNATASLLWLLHQCFPDLKNKACSCMFCLVNLVTTTLSCQIWFTLIHDVKRWTEVYSEWTVLIDDPIYSSSNPLLLLEADATMMQVSVSQCQDAGWRSSSDAHTYRPDPLSEGHHLLRRKSCFHLVLSTTLGIEASSTNN